VQWTGNKKNLFKDGAVFIPTKEVLTFLDGISNVDSDSSTLNRLFDFTYFDLVKKLIEPSTDSEEQKTIWFKQEISNRLNGQFVFDEASVSFMEGEYREYKKKKGTHFKRSKRSYLSTTMTAEGYKKIGMLQRLLENQAIGTGVNGPLFWDEPDSNMNPKLMRLLVQILIELSRNGQQIILATHDYVLLKWFDLLMDKGKEDNVRFHALSSDPETKEIEIQSTNSYRLIDPNAIADTFDDLTKEQVKLKMGGLGK